MNSVLHLPFIFHFHSWFTFPFPGLLLAFAFMQTAVQPTLLWGALQTSYPSIMISVPPLFFFPTCFFLHFSFFLLLFVVCLLADCRLLFCTNFPSIMISVLPPLFCQLLFLEKMWCQVLWLKFVEIPHGQRAYWATRALLIWLLIHHGHDQCPLFCQPLFQTARWLGLGIVGWITLSARQFYTLQTHITVTDVG